MLDLVVEGGDVPKCEEAQLWPVPCWKRCFFAVSLCALGAGCSKKVERASPAPLIAQQELRKESVSALAPALSEPVDQPSSHASQAGVELLPDEPLAKTSKSIEPLEKAKDEVHDSSNHEQKLPPKGSEPSSATKFRYVKVALTKGKRKAIGNSGMTVEISRISHKHRAGDGKAVGILELFLRHQGKRMELRWVFDPRQTSTPWRSLEGRLPYSEKLGRRPLWRVPGWRVRILSIKSGAAPDERVYVVGFGKKSAAEL